MTLGVIWLAISSISVNIESQKPSNSPTIVVGTGPLAKKSVEDLRLAYPEAAIEVSGDIFIASSMTPSIERVSDDRAISILTNQQKRTGYRSVFSDISHLGNGLFLVVDSAANELIKIDREGNVIEVIPGPDLGRGHHFISSLSVHGDDLLVSAQPARLHGQSQWVSIDESALYRYAGENGWSTVATASGIYDQASFRDAKWLSDNKIAALIGPYFLIFENQNLVEKINLGFEFGGGIVDAGNKWLVGSYTQILEVDKSDFSVSSHETPVKFANVGHIQQASDGRLLVTDTDQQTVVVLDEKEDDYRRIGNTQGSLKFVDLAAGPDGVYLLENTSPHVYKYKPWSGNVDLVAGDGQQGYDTPKSAKDFSFQYPSGLTVSPSGDVYVTDANYRLVRVANWFVDIFSGDIHAGSSNDGDSREVARYGALRGLNFSDGELLVADQGNHSVWKISADGHVERVMGTGYSGLWEEGQVATTQPLNQPSGVLRRKDGTILIADSYNNAVVQIRLDGTVSRFAGAPKGTIYQGHGSYSGDGGKAIDAELNTPRRMTEDEEGNVYIVDEFNNAIRKVDVEGNIETFAGGAFGFAPDATAFSWPQSAVVYESHLYVADTGNDVVWAIPID